MTEERAIIQAFLEAHSLQAEDLPDIRKAGLVVYIKVNSSPRRGEVGRGAGLHNAQLQNLMQASPHPNPPPMGEGIRYMVMTPVANKPDMGLPEFQICKGTRMYHDGNQWRDMRGNVPDGATLEALPHTAIREGIEELGIRVSNIARAQMLGEYRFTSATNRRDVSLWLLGAEMKNAEDFLPQEAVASVTHERRWMTLAEFNKEGRPDHAHILGQVEALLCA